MNVCPCLWLRKMYARVHSSLAWAGGPIWYDTTVSKYWNKSQPPCFRQTSTPAQISIDTFSISILRKRKRHSYSPLLPHSKDCFFFGRGCHDVIVCTCINILIYLQAQNSQWMLIQFCNFTHCFVQGWRSTCLWSSVAVLAEIPLRSPRKLFIFIIKKFFFRIKVSKKNDNLILKKEALLWSYCIQPVKMFSNCNYIFCWMLWSYKYVFFIVKIIIFGVTWPVLRPTEL